MKLSTVFRCITAIKSNNKVKITATVKVTQIVISHFRNHVLTINENFNRFTICIKLNSLTFFRNTIFAFGLF
jgi:hypothetical protein